MPPPGGNTSWQFRPEKPEERADAIQALHDQLLFLRQLNRWVPTFHARVSWLTRDHDARALSIEWPRRPLSRFDRPPYRSPRSRPFAPGYGLRSAAPRRPFARGRTTRSP